MEGLIVKPERRRAPLVAVLSCIAMLLFINTLLLSALVGGLAMFAVKAQPIVSAIGPEDVHRVQAALHTMEEANIVKNVGKITSSLSNIHLLPTDLLSTAYAVLGLDYGAFAKSFVDISGSALQAVQGLKFDTTTEAQGYAYTANVLNVGTSLAKEISSWSRVNTAPPPDLGILDAILGTGEAGSGTSWVMSQLNVTELKKVSTACSALQTQLVDVNVPSVTWKPFMPSPKADSQGKYTLVVDAQYPTQHLLTPNQWSQIHDAVGHVCSGINEFANKRIAATSVEESSH